MAATQPAVNAHQQLVLSYQATFLLPDELVLALLDLRTDSARNHINAQTTT